jgi:hypothetical protein
MTPKRRLGGLIPFLLGFAACTTSPPDSLPAGQYGNGQVLMTVAASNASVLFGCGTGTVDGAIPLDNHSRFDVPGQVVFGPIVVNPPGVDARFTGSLTGDIVFLTVTIDGDPGPSTLGPYALARGGSGPPVICAD